MLDGTGWGVVVFPEMLQQLERATKLSMQGVGGVSHHRQTTALQWAVGREGGNDDMAARLHGVAYLRDIGGAVVWVGQEVEYRAVMPDVIPGCGKRLTGYVASNPSHLLRARPKPAPRYVQRRA